MVGIHGEEESAMIGTERVNKIDFFLNEILIKHFVFVEI